MKQPLPFLGVATLFLAGAGAGKGKVVDFQLEADRCGHWVATIHATGKGILRLASDTDVIAEWDVIKSLEVEVSGSGAPERLFRLTAQVGRGRPVERSLILPVMDAQWTITPEDLLVPEDKEARFNVRVTTPCEVTRLTFDATIRQTGVTREGNFLGPGDGWFVAPAESKGVYDIDVVLREEGVVLSKRSIFYEVGEVDIDGDGHKHPRAGGKDCDESDPNAHPGAREVPNGKDDDCDGQIDE